MKKKNIIISLTAFVLIVLMGVIVFRDNYDQNYSDAAVSSKISTIQLPDNPNLNVAFDLENLEEIYLAGGCFWGLEAYMTRIFGVYDVTSGYANGNTDNPSYEDVIYNYSGHAETVHVTYDPSLVNLETLLAYYLKVVDPTSVNRQGNDRGTQYRTGIYYTDAMDLMTIETALNQEQMNYEDHIVVEVEPLEKYTLAETYHQDYLEKNPKGYCHIDLMDVEEDLSVYVKPSDAALKATLTPLQYKVTQEEGTERAFENAYWDFYEEGIYVDIVTGQPLFASVDKYKSGTGWPSFTKPISQDLIKELVDTKLGFESVEVRSTLGDSHLGHIFKDGPIEAGGLRYCLNSAALKFIPREELEAMNLAYLNQLFE